MQQRHLMNDLVSLLPHAKKEAKLDTKSKLFYLNELADISNCDNVVFFEARKHGQDVYLWLAKAPNGPSIKFHLQNLHTMDELKLIGNCLKGSRPILSFDSNFDTKPFTKLIKELLIHIFGVPPGARRSKPFIDHTIADGKFWYRNYQIQEKELEKNQEDDISLIEIGPRFVLIIIFEGSFGGPVIYENKEFISPNVARAAIIIEKGEKYKNRISSKVDRELRKPDRTREFDPLADEILFA